MVASYLHRVSQQLLCAFSFLTYKHLRAESSLHSGLTPGNDRGYGSGKIKIKGVVRITQVLITNYSLKSNTTTSLTFRSNH